MVLKVQTDLVFTTESKIWVNMNKLGLELTKVKNFITYQVLPISVFTFIDDILRGSGFRIK